MTKLLIVLAVLLTGAGVSAETLRCSMTLITPFESDPSEGDWIAPGAEIIAFDHDTQAEQALYLSIETVYWPSNPTIQRTLKQVSDPSKAAFTLEFSRTDPYGNPLPQTSYGYFQILKGQSKKDARWTRSVGRTASLFNVPVAAGVTGQATMICTEK